PHTLTLSTFISTSTATTAIYTLSLHDALPIFLFVHSKRIAHKQIRGYILFHNMPNIGDNSLMTKQFASHGDLEDKVVSFEKLSRSEEHTSELQSRENLVCRLLLEKKKEKQNRA